MIGGYLSLITACFCAAIKAFSGKKISAKVARTADAMYANGVRMVICVIIGLIIALIADGPAALIPSGSTFLIAFISAAANATMLISWVLAVKTGALVLLDIFLLLGSSLPLVLSAVYFDEGIVPVQYVGLAVMLLAVIVMCTYNNTIKTKLTLKGVMLLLLCGFTNGIVSFAQKYFTKTEPGGSITVFNLWAFLFAAVIIFAALFIVLLSGKKSAEKDSDAPPPQLVSLSSIYGFVIIMAVALFVNNFAITYAAKMLDAVLVYPAQNAINIIFTTLMANIIFKEKINLKGIIGIILALVSIFLINVLPKL